MESPTNKRLAELYTAWLGKIPPTFAGQYNEIIPMKDLKGKPIKTVAKVTWNGLRTRYEMEPMEETFPDVFVLTYMDIPSGQRQNFLNIWAEIGITKFHRILVDGKAPEEHGSTLPECLAPKTVKPGK